MMQDDALQKKLRDGSYYEEARRWYAEVYIFLISERILYIVLTTIALLTLAFSLGALMNLLPLKPVEPLIVRYASVVNQLPLIHPLQQKGEDPDAALRRYFLTEYVARREKYHKDTIGANARYLLHHSDENTYRLYLRYFDTANPRSPILRYGSTARRGVTVGRVAVEPQKETGKYRARVEFQAVVHAEDKTDTSNWTAQINFDYQGIRMEPNDDPTVHRALKVTPMQFKVTDYTVQQRR